MRVCKLEDCQERHDAKGYCHKHYERWRRNGDPRGGYRSHGSGSVRPNGYIMIVRGNIAKFEHVRVAESALGKELPKKALVHHANGNPGDNRPENLVICPDDKYHFLLHIRMRAIEACGNVDYRRCLYCKKHDDPANMRGFHSITNPNGRFYHRLCRNSYRRNQNECTN